MANSNNTSPATQADLNKIGEKLVQHDAQFEILLRQLDAISQDVKQHFEVVIEDLKHDVLGIFQDRTEQHGDQLNEFRSRLDRIERHLGLVA